MNSTGSVLIWTMRQLYSYIEQGQLELQPTFQRKLVWNNKHKEKFIETILKNLPFPEIYVSRSVGDPIMSVVDGQQRIHTIYQYITGDPSLRLKGILPFDHLTNEEINAFMDYQVVVRDLGVLEHGTVVDIFDRINSVGYALKSIELQNALYEGEFISTAHEILDAKPLDDFELFSQSQYSRMQDLEFILLIMCSIELDGYFTGTNELENLIIRYDEQYENKEQMEETILGTFEFLRQMVLPKDSLWLRKSSFFSLVVELAKYYNFYSHFPDVDSFRHDLLKLEEEILRNRYEDIKNNMYAKFYNYIYQATASRIGRSARGELVYMLLNG